MSERTIATPAGPAPQPARVPWRVPDWMVPFERYLPTPEIAGSVRWIERIEDAVNCRNPEEYGYGFILARAKLVTRIWLLCELREAGLLVSRPRPGWDPKSGFEADVPGKAR
jgi:hypothetical protein